MDKLPKDNKNDYIIKGAKGLAGAVPFVGGAIAEIIEAGLKPRLTTGMDEWMISIAERIERIEQNNGIKILESLPNNEEFISVLLEASSRAVKTHKQNKRKWLKNMVVNSSFGNLEFDKKMLFFNYLDQLSEYHLKMIFLIKQNQEKIEKREALEYNATERYIEKEAMPEDPKIAAYMRSQLEDMIFIDSIVQDGTGYMVLTPHAEEFYNFIMETD